MKSGFLLEEDVKIVTKQIVDRIRQVERSRKEAEEKASNAGESTPGQQPPSQQASNTSQQSQPSVQVGYQEVILFVVILQGITNRLFEWLVAKN